MRITHRQLRQIIREELIREARNPLVAKLQAMLGMPTQEQDGIWGEVTDLAWAEFIEDKLGQGAGGRKIVDPAGNEVTPSDIAPNWQTLAPQISGGLIMKNDGTPGGRRIPQLTGDTKGAIDFINFLGVDLPAIGTRTPPTNWFYTSGGSSPADDSTNLSNYPGFNYKSWPKWTYIDPINKNPDGTEIEVSNASPNDLVSRYTDFKIAIKRGDYVNIAGNSDAFNQGGYFYTIRDTQTLNKFFGFS